MHYLQPLITYFRDLILPLRLLRGVCASTPVTGLYNLKLHIVLYIFINKNEEIYNSDRDHFNDFYNSTDLNKMCSIEKG